jgi:hypothetical protein
MQLTRLKALGLEIGTENTKGMRRALLGISRLGSLNRLRISFSMKQLPDTIGQLTALNSLQLDDCNSLSSFQTPSGS